MKVVLLNGEGRLPPGWGLGDFDFGDPLDPFEAAPAGRDQTNRESVAVGQSLPCYMGGEQEVLGVVEGEASIVSGNGADQYATGSLGWVGFVKYP